MADPIVITVLIENTVYTRGLVAEHGLAIHIRVGRRGLLFDTGQTDLLLRNARALGIDLAQTEAIILSHGHDDHTGGIEAVRQAVPRARLFLHPAALSPKFVLNSAGTGRPIGMGQGSAGILQGETELVVRTTTPTEVLDGLFVTGEIPRLNSFEDTGGPFFLDPACVHPDPLHDDQALFFDTAQGLVVLFGCAHAGVVNTLDYIQRLAGGRPVHTILGGLHLIRSSRERMDKTLFAFRRWDIQQLAPGHCTGVSAISELWAASPRRCSSCAVGLRMRFER